MIKQKRQRHLRVWYPISFIAPFFIVYGVFNLFPTIYTFILSLTKWDGVGVKTFVGLENYVKLFTTDKFFLPSLQNTLLLALGYAPVQMVVAMLLAVFLSGRLAKLKNLHQTVLFLPYITMAVAIGLVFSQLFQQKGGAVNTLLSNLGVINTNIAWLRKGDLARIVTMLMIYWRYLGYICVLFMAGIIGISTDIFEAAEIDGASAAQRFFHITLPLLKPILLFVMVTSISGCLQVFDEPFMLFTTNVSPGVQVGGPSGAVLTTVWYMYDMAFGRFMQYGYASAISCALFILIVLLSVFGYRFFTRKDDY